MRIKYSYLEEQFKNHREIFESIEKLIATGEYTLGKEVEKFEKRFANFIGSKYAVGVNSGTDALFLSLKAINIGEGDNVITTPNTFIATVGAIIAAGAKPIFVDVQEDFTMNPYLLEKAITPNTKAIIPVHYAGHPANMPEIMKIAEKYGIKVVEDACQAISSEIDKKKVGTYGETGCFSLHPLKNLNVWGDGGIIITNTKKINDKLILLRNHGLKNRDEIEIFGYNSRLDTLQAIVGNYLIKNLDDITAKRIKWAAYLDKGLADLKEYITIPKREKNRRYVFHLYMLLARNRDNLLIYLKNNGIEAKIHYPIPLHLQKAAIKLNYQKGDFPVTENHCKTIITLPVHQHLEEKHISYIIDKMHEFYTEGKYASKIS